MNGVKLAGIWAIQSVVWAILVAPLHAAIPKPTPVPTPMPISPGRQWNQLAREEKPAWKREVVALQLLLRHAGTRKMAPTGLFDAQTEREVMALEATRGIGVDGRVGPQTWGVTVVTVQKGDRGDAVRAVQFALRSPLSGIFDAKTENAVRRFQKSRGLGATGRVGLDTWCVLLGGTVKK